MFPVGEKIPIAVVCYGFGKGLFQNYCQWCVWKGIFSFPVVVDTKQLGLAMAASLWMLLPSILVFRFGQTYLEAGLTKGAVKG